MEYEHQVCIDLESALACADLAVDYSRPKYIAGAMDNTGLSLCARNNREGKRRRSNL